MRSKKKVPRKSARRRSGHRAMPTGSVQRREFALNERLDALTEQIEIMIPEMTARIAALEHLLLEKHLCTREELISAREFVRILED